MQILPFECLLVIALGLAIFSRREMRALIKDFTTVGEDRWTWSTCDGECFEDVELQYADEGEVVLRHKYGTSRVAVDRLNAKSLALLTGTPQWRQVISAEPVEDRVGTMIEPAHAEAA